SPADHTHSCILSRPPPSAAALVRELTPASSLSVAIRTSTRGGLGDSSSQPHCSVASRLRSLVRDKVMKLTVQPTTARASTVENPQANRLSKRSSKGGRVSATRHQT